MTTRRPVLIHILFHPDDRKRRDELTRHLAPLTRSGVVHSWDETMIRGGEDRTRAIHESLARADVVLVLVSARLMAWDDYHDRYQGVLRERAASGRLRVVPVLIAPTLWRDDALLGALQVLPKNLEPVASWSDRDEAWLEVIRELQQLAERAAASTPPPSSPPPPSNPPPPSRPPSADEPSEPTAPAPSKLDWKNPASILAAAIAAVPVLKYALGVAGVAAVVAIVTIGFGLSPGTAIIGALVVLAAMLLLILLSAAARSSAMLHRPAQALTWSVLCLTMGGGALLLSCLFFDSPKSWRCITDGECAPRPTPIQLQDGGATGALDLALAAGSISGRVTDERGDPFPGVRVAIPKYAVASATTDQWGAYRIEVSAPRGEPVELVAACASAARCEPFSAWKRVGDDNAGFQVRRRPK